MQTILRQIYRARRRWIASLGFQFLAYGIFVSFSIAMILLLVPKFVWLPMATDQVAIAVLATAAVISSLAALGMTWWYRPSLGRAAVEVDLRLKLKERLSSVLSMRENPESVVAQALVADAERAAERIDVRDAFPLVLNTRSWLMFVPAILALAMLWIPNASATGSTNTPTQSVTQADIENAVKPLAAMVQQAKEDAEENGLQEAADFYKKLEKQIDNLKRPGMQDSKKLLTDLNALKQEMEKRREQLGSPESMKKNLASMKEFTEGPAEKMAEAMKEGNFEEASESIEKMMEDLEKQSLSEDDMKKLEKQLDSLAKALEQAAADHEQAKQEIENKIAQAEQAGDMQKAAELRKNLADKKAEDAQMADMVKMAEQMKEAKECLGKGDCKAAQNAMKEMKAQMDKMSKNAAQSKSLSKMLQEAKEAKSKACDGTCDADGNGVQGKGISKDGKPKWKNGQGEGPGGGPRDEKETDTKHVDSQVRTDVDEGETVYGGKAGGANRKGKTLEEVQQAIRSSEIEDEQALETIVLPKRQRDQTRDYFDSLRK